MPSFRAQVLAGTECYVCDGLPSRTDAALWVDRLRVAAGATDAAPLNFFVGASYVAWCRGVSASYAGHSRYSPFSSDDVNHMDEPVLVGVRCVPHQAQDAARVPMVGDLVANRALALETRPGQPPHHFASTASASTPTRIQPSLPAPVATTGAGMSGAAGNVAVGGEAGSGSGSGSGSGPPPTPTPSAGTASGSAATASEPSLANLSASTSGGGEGSTADKHASHTTAASAAQPLAPVQEALPMWEAFVRYNSAGGVSTNHTPRPRTGGQPFVPDLPHQEVRVFSLHPKTRCVLGPPRVLRAADIMAAVPPLDVVAKERVLGRFHSAAEAAWAYDDVVRDQSATTPPSVHPNHFVQTNFPRPGSQRDSGDGGVQQASDYDGVVPML